MNNNEKQNSIKIKILDKIKSGKIKMRPKITFALRIIGLVVIIVLLAVFVIFLISFIFYTDSFPWILILIALFFILLIEVLMHKFGFSYHRPIIYSLVLILLIAILSGFVVHTTPLHNNVSCFCNKKQIPIITSLYKKYEKTDIPKCGCGSCDQFPEELK